MVSGSTFAGSPAYNICLAYDLEGPLAVHCLEKSLVEIVNRHASLRTIFQKRGSVPVQVVSEDTTFSLAFEDVTHIPMSEREDEARMLYVQESQRGFDLTKGPLFRCLLLRIDPHRHILLFTMSHIISDGWSVRVLSSGNLCPFIQALSPITQ